MRIMFFLVLSLTGFSGYSQVAKKPATPPAPTWQEKFFLNSEEVIPMLIEQAMKVSPEMETNRAQKQSVIENTKITKKAIISGLSLGGGYFYGSRLAFNGPDQIGGVNPFSQPARGFYNIGVNLGIPLGQLLSRHNQIHIQELNLQQAEAQGKLQERGIRQMVIQMYQEIVMAKAELELRQEALQSTNIHYKMAEKQLVNGQILITEMARLNEIHSAAAIGHGTAKIRYETSFLMLEEILGMRISDLMKDL